MSNLIDIISYGVPHNKGNGGSGGNTYITYNGGTYNTSTYDGNRSFQDIDGNEAQFQYIIAGEGQIIKLEGDELKYNFGYIGELESDSIKAGKVDTDELNAVKGFIENLDCKKITTEYLTVTKQAHFFELIIDKVRAVGGQIILTPAQCTIDKVYAYNSNNQLVSDPVTNINSVAYFNVYWRNEDELGHGITNDWLAHDQALCQSFNVTAGTHHNIANKYYWRHVDSVLADKMINFETNEIKNVGDSLTGTNNISISMKYTYQGDMYNGIVWTPSAQTLPGVQTGVTWVNSGSSVTYALSGTMKTSSTTFGIQILPSGDYSKLKTTKLEFHIYNTDGNVAQPQINVGVYFNDGSSLYFPNVQVDNNFDVTLDLGTPTGPIEAIVVNCSQPVQWHQCHGIRLSNSNCDEMISPQASVPEEGDTIVQLGYQGTDEENKQRQSAIIIAAYQTPDADLTAPSYAQYMGINDFHLREHRGSYIDANGAEFLGDIRLAKIGTDAQGNVITMSELVVDVNGIHTQVTNLQDADRQLSTRITQTAEAITSEANARIAADNGLVSDYNSKITQQADRITAEVNARVAADNNLVSDYNSKITQQADRITAEVNARVAADNGLVNDYTSKISQSANSITSSVKSWANGQFVTGTTFTQTTNSISLSVQSVSDDVDGVKQGLINTGINITTGEIALNANKLKVNGVSGDAIALEVKNANNKQIAVIQGKNGWGRISVNGPDTGYQSWITLEPQSTNCLFNIKSGNSFYNINANGSNGTLGIGLNASNAINITANNKININTNRNALYLNDIPEVDGSSLTPTGNYISGKLVADYLNSGRYALYIKT